MQAASFAKDIHYHLRKQFQKRSNKLSGCRPTSEFNNPLVYFCDKSDSGLMLTQQKGDLETKLAIKYESTCMVVMVVVVADTYF